MPYNTTAIPPRKEPTGQTQLPLTRVKKIISLDPDIKTCSNNAVFIITLATEMFVQHLMSEAHTMSLVGGKARRTIQYNHIAEVVTRHDNLEFLEDTVPRAVPYGKIKKQAARTRASIEKKSAANKSHKAGGSKGGSASKSGGNKNSGSKIGGGDGGDGKEQAGRSKKKSLPVNAEFTLRDSGGGSRTKSRKASIAQPGTETNQAHQEDVEMG